jgi:valyl-tRNA synthetase
MIRASFLLAGLLAVCPATFCQQAEADAQTMQAVLSEIRQLRHDLQIAANAARRAQIVIFRFHEQTTMVERASQTLEITKNQLQQIEWQKENMETQIKMAFEVVDRTDSEEQRTRREEFQKSMQEQLATLEAGEQELKAKEMEQEADLKAARGKLEQLESELDQLDRDIEETAVQASK